MRSTANWVVDFSKRFIRNASKRNSREEVSHSLPQQELKLFYKGEELKQTYRPDLLCYEKIIVELKALRDLTGEHRSQVLNYLKATDLRLGLLVNFGCQQKATVERIIL